MDLLEVLRTKTGGGGWGCLLNDDIVGLFFSQSLPPSMLVPEFAVPTRVLSWGSRERTSCSRRSVFRLVPGHLLSTCIKLSVCLQNLHKCVSSSSVSDKHKRSLYILAKHFNPSASIGNAGEATNVGKGIRTMKKKCDLSRVWKVQGWDFRRKWIFGVLDLRN